MPPRRVCSASAGLRVSLSDSNNSFGKRVDWNTVEPPTRSNIRSNLVKSVRFVEPTDNDNSVNERLESDVDNMEALYATVCKRNSPSKERGVIPQVPLNIQPGKYGNMEGDKGFRPYRHLRQNTELSLSSYKVIKNIFSMFIFLTWIHMNICLPCQNLINNYELLVLHMLHINP